MIRSLLLCTLLLSIKFGSAQCSVQMAVNSAECNGIGSVNSIIANATGQAPFQYAWSTGDTTNIADSLNYSTVYMVTITDDTGCVASDTAAIGFYLAMSNITVNNTSCPTCCDGSVTLNLGPLPPTLCSIITYSLNPGGSFPANPVTNITGLCAATYTVMANTQFGCGCSNIVTFTIGSNATGLSGSFLEAGNGAAIYPNPSGGKLHFKDLAQTNDLVIIYSEKGGELKRFTIGPGAEYAVDELPDGMYAVKILRNKIPVHTEKLVLIREK